MICRRRQLTVSVFAAMVLVAAATHAGDSVEPERILMTENPLSAEQARAMQTAWADHLGFEVVVENSIGMQFCVIPPGTFPMGESKRNRPVVTHSGAYLIGRYEVTQGEWERVMGRLPSQLVHGKGDRFPVYRISYAEASEFCRKLTGLEREAGTLPEGYEYRLPTDAEWEYACRAGTLTATYFGDSLNSRQANFDGSKPLNGAETGPNLARTAEVGSYPANAWGLHDMHGNLCEWAIDWYHPKPKGGIDPVQLTPAPKRLLRDGRHSSIGHWCRSANRYHMDPKVRPGSVGVRPVLTKLQHDAVEPERVLMTEHSLSAEDAQAKQKAWAEHLGVDAVVENSIGMQLSVIPPGTFPMGKEDHKGEDGPQEVTHTQPYFIGRYEVTQGEWERVMGPLLKQPTVGAGDRFPVYNINYPEAAEFCRKLTGLDREAGKLPEGYEYRLPTSAEWEYACRAGTLTATYFGDGLSSSQANFDGSIPLNGAEKGPNLGRTAEVGSYPGNAWGLHDTYGNLYEWCLDWFHKRPKAGVDPVHLLPGPERRRPERVRNGGCHSHAGRYCRSSNRFFEPPEMRSSKIGLRPVLTKLHLDGLHQLTDAAHTDGNQCWTRDGKNTRIWNKRNFTTGTDWVMAGHVSSPPGEPFATPRSDTSYHTWAHTCLTDGRILVRSNPPNQELGYYLMTPHRGGTPEFERIQCDLATEGVLDRISLSPSETRICFEFQTGFDSDVPGRTLYVADFDAKQPAITGAKPFANEDGKPIWYAFPRWSQDESAIIYHAGEKLHLYNLANKSTMKVSVADSVDDPRMKRAPK